MTQFTAIEVADYIRARAGVPSYDTMKLQKLVYFAQAWHIAWVGKPLFDEAFEAWTNGPVVRSIYREQKRNALKGREKVTGEAAAIIDGVCDFYGARNFSELIELTHKDEPWAEARAGLPAGAPSRKPLEPSTLRDFYVHRALESDVAKPKRPAVGATASRADLTAAAEAAVERWRGALTLLAER